MEEALELASSGNSWHHISGQLQALATEHVGQEGCADILQQVDNLLSTHPQWTGTPIANLGHLEDADAS